MTNHWNEGCSRHGGGASGVPPIWCPEEGADQLVEYFLSLVEHRVLTPVDAQVYHGAWISGLGIPIKRIAKAHIPWVHRLRRKKPGATKGCPERGQRGGPAGAS